MPLKKPKKKSPAKLEFAKHENNQEFADKIRAILDERDKIDDSKSLAKEQVLVLVVNGHDGKECADKKHDGAVGDTHATLTLFARCGNSIVRYSGFELLRRSDPELDSLFKMIGM